MHCLLHLRWAGAAALVALTISHASVSAPSRCEQVLSRFGSRLADATCSESADLTTANPATTPANDAIATLPRFAFTPQTDRDTIAPDPSHRTPIAGPVPGVQIEARIAEDPQGQARVLMRLPDSWNRRLVVAQRIQRRFCLERLRPAEGLRLRLAKQGHAQFNGVERGGFHGLPAQSVIDHLRSFL
jgi:hypothetical protein